MSAPVLHVTRLWEHGILASFILLQEEISHSGLEQQVLRPDSLGVGCHLLHDFGQVISHLFVFISSANWDNNSTYPRESFEG